jgi:hypothetical protein
MAEEQKPVSKTPMEQRTDPDVGDRWGQDMKDVFTSFGVTKKKEEEKK